MADAGVRAQAASRVTGRTPPGVEKGVTGKEKMFQQNRQFGPGAMKVYPYSKPAPQTNNGVYHGGSRPRPIPNGPDPRTPNTTKGIVRRPGEVQA